MSDPSECLRGLPEAPNACRVALWSDDYEVVEHHVTPVEAMPLGATRVGLEVESTNSLTAMVRYPGQSLSTRSMLSSVSMAPTREVALIGRTSHGGRGRRTAGDCSPVPWRRMHPALKRLQANRSRPTAMKEIRECSRFAALTYDHCFAQLTGCCTVHTVTSGVPNDAPAATSCVVLRSAPHGAPCPFGE